jgi:outer membrane protein OmpA-like peptidoglycan-associated protein
MFGISIRSKKKAKDEAEKPFWISYADMMTSLMVLFLVVMSVTLLAVTKTVTEEEKAKKVRDDEVNQCLHEIEKVTELVEKDFPGLKFDKQHKIVDFGPQAWFAYNKFAVAPKTATHLRQFTKELLRVARLPCGKKWLKRVGIEGYTSPEGTYLSNLKLSLDRSQKVLCVLLEPESGNNPILTKEDRDDIQKYFWAAGFSSKSVKKTPEAARRVEFILKFRAWGEPEEDLPKHTYPLGRCKL